MPQTALAASDSPRAKRDALIEQYQKFVDFVAARLIKRMGLPHTLYDELRAAGYLGLVEAAERFDGRRGRDFRPFAFLRVRGAIIDSIRRISDLSGKAYRYARALQAAEELREEIYFEQGARPAGTPLRDKEARLAKILDYAATCAFAFRLSVCDAEPEISEHGDDGRETPEEAIDRRAMAGILRRLVCDLPEKERRIIEGYYFEDKSFAELICGDERLSKSWISRLHARALVHLRDRLIENLTCGHEHEAAQKEKA
jgi:RNA polymerase sigma factor for flagellar operon FliA